MNMRCIRMVLSRYRIVLYTMDRMGYDRVKGDIVRYMTNIYSGTQYKIR